MLDFVSFYIYFAIFFNTIFCSRTMINFGILVGIVDTVDFIVSIPLVEHPVMVPPLVTLPIALAKPDVDENCGENLYCCCW